MGLRQERSGRFAPFTWKLLFGVGCLCLYLPATAPAQVALEVVHDFNPATEGSSPGPLIQGSDGNFYGTAGAGGALGYGTVFRMTRAGAVTVLHAFESSEGAPTGGVIEGDDGSLYGATGGGSGRIYQLTPSGSFSMLYEFTGGADGRDLVTPLVLGIDGNLYGTTRSGGTSGQGTFFRIAPSGLLTVLRAFAGYPDDFSPGYPLLLAADGNFYSISSTKLVRLAPDGTRTAVYNFGYSSARYPNTPLMQGADGAFYGMTFGSTYGGALTWGDVYRVTAKGDFRVLHEFSPGNLFSREPLIQAADGDFYGVYVDGLFRMNSAGTVTIFGGYLRGLLQAADGHIYGTSSGGAYGGGQVLRFFPRAEAPGAPTGLRVIR